MMEGVTKTSNDMVCLTSKKMLLHPLMLEPVLEVLFEKCDFERLKVARLVCKQWLYLSDNEFRKKSVVNFYSMYPETYIDLINSINEGHHFIPLNVALTMSPMYGEPMYYNRNLTVCPWHACEEFIFPFGESIESLKFYAWDSISDRLNASLFSQILLTPKHLKTLEVSLLPSEISCYPIFQYPWESQAPLFSLNTLVMYGKVECTQTFMYNFLCAMPNVTSITVNCCSSEFLDLFCAALYDVPLKLVQHLKLNFSGTFTDTHLRNIRRAGLPLRTLHIAPRSWVTNFEDYRRLFAQVALTLVDAKLTICTRLISLEQYVDLPFMPKLKILRLQSWRGGQAFWNLSFLNNVPQLETLVMERRGLFAPIQNQEEQTQCFLDQKDVTAHENLKNLVLPSMPLFFPHQECLTSMFSKFSKLVKLTLSANDTSLECVFQCAPQLEELTIAEYSKITDEGITGLSGEELMINDNTINYDVRVGITRLKGLRRLEVDGFWGNITDLSVMHGIMHLRKLESVILRGCKISEWGRKTLSTLQLTVVGHDTFHIFEPEPLEDIII